MVSTSQPDPAEPYWLSEPADLRVVVGRDGRIESVSASCVRLLGCLPQELIDHPWQGLVEPDDVNATEEFVEHAFRQRAEMRGFGNRLRSRDGRSLFLEWTVQAVGDRLFAAGRDVTPQRRLEQLVARSEALVRTAFEEAPVGMCMLTLNGFLVDANPAFARTLGADRDEMIGLSIRELLCEEDRQKFDENLARLEAGQTTQYETERRFSRSDGQTVWTQATVRVVTLPHGERGLLAHVLDITDRKRDQRLLARDLDELTAAKQLRDALADDRLVLYWQPIVELATNRVERHEVLVRLEDGGELVMPDRFLPVAERFGLIADLDHAVLTKALALVDAGRTINLNISARSLADPRILAAVASAAKRSALDPARVCFEITETALADDIEDVMRFADDARSLGCQIAIDDFGAGYGGLVYLRRLGAISCALKIEREFVTSVGSSSADRHIVEATVALARGFDLDVVAEGVEDPATAAHLVDIGVTHAQGWLYGRPQPALPRAGNPG
jgi:PAS domain S-box-containing protein